MNFLVDAQLPRHLARRLQEAGHDALHTLDLPAGNRSSDSELNTLSLRESRVVITKDADFVNSYIAAPRRQLKRVPFGGTRAPPHQRRSHITVS